MIYFKQITISLAVVTALSFTGCGSSDGDSGSVETSKFNSARQMNLSELDNYDLITGDGVGVINLRSVSVENNDDSSIPDDISLKLSNILKETIKYSIDNAEVKNKSSNLRSVTEDGDIATLKETTNGNISGTQTINFKINKRTGKLTGTMTYSNYKNSESNSCGGDEIDNLNGTMSVTGKFNISNSDLETMTINLNSSFYIDDMVWKSGASITITYNHSSSFDEDSLISMTIEATKGNESVGFKDCKIRSYNDNGYEYSYPVEGNLYVFTNNINGYFSVDTNYDHSLTPTKKDLCGKYTYSGKEKYIGKNSNLIWEITSTNNYKIEIDSNNDGIIDINKTGIIDNEF